jgi:hypothetical protein
MAEAGISASALATPLSWRRQSLATWRIAAVYLILAALVLYPVLTIQVPGLCDFFNHLARMHILSDYAVSPTLKHFYTVKWRLAPYMGMDSVFTLFSAFGMKNIYAAGKLYIAACILLPVLSATVLHYVIHKKLSLVPAAAFLVSYNFLLSWGFVNYLPGICLAVLVLSGWIYTDGWPRWRRVALFCVPATFLYLFHLMAFVGYCVAVAGYEVAAASRASLWSWRSLATRAVAAGLQAAPAIVMALSVHVEPLIGPVATRYFAEGKGAAIASPVLFFLSPADRIAGGLALFLLIFGLLTNRLRMAPVVWGPFLAVLVVAAAMPHVVHGIFGMDYRLPLMLALLLIAGAGATERMGPRAGSLAIGCILAMTAVRSVGIASTLRRLDGQIGEVRRVLATMPRGMRLLVVQSPISRRDVPMRRATQHVALLAVVDRDAFVPYLFTWFMTVRPTPAMLASSTPVGSPLDLSDIQAGFGRKDSPGAPQGDGLGGRVYWMGWEHKFDYLLYEHFGRRPAALPGNVRLVSSSSVADLYRIERGSRAPAAGSTLALPTRRLYLLDVGRPDD